MKWFNRHFLFITFENQTPKTLLRLLFSIFFCFFFFVLQAQVSSPFSFTHYSMVNGLASNEVTSIVQDRTGYLWISSNNGLQRFDGVQYKNFRHRNVEPKSLPSNIIAQVYVDKEDNLWVLSSFGDIGIFDKSSFTYKPDPR